MFYQFYLLLFVTIIILKLAVLDIVVISPKNESIDAFSDLPAEFGTQISLSGLTGYVVRAWPIHACSPILIPPSNYSLNTTWFVLIKRGDCDFDYKVLNAQRAGYELAIVYNGDNEDLIPMHGFKYSQYIHIPSVFIGKNDGYRILERYQYNSGYVLKVVEDQVFDLNNYILPFGIVVGLCFCVMVAFVIVKYVRERRYRMRNRLTARNLKAIPVKKYQAGDASDTCAVCLDDYVEGDKLRILPCSHAYHSKCIDPWLTNNKRNCPICKRKIVFGKKKSGETNKHKQRRHHHNHRRRRHHQERVIAPIKIPSHGDVDNNERTPLVQHMMEGSNMDILPRGQLHNTNQKEALQQRRQSESDYGKNVHSADNITISKHKGNVQRQQGYGAVGLTNNHKDTNLNKSTTTTINKNTLSASVNAKARTILEVRSEPENYHDDESSSNCSLTGSQYSTGTNDENGPSSSTSATTLDETGPGVSSSYITFEPPTHHLQVYYDDSETESSTISLPPLARENDQIALHEDGRAKPSTNPAYSSNLVSGRNYDTACPGPQTFTNHHPEGYDDMSPLIVSQDGNRTQTHARHRFFRFMQTVGEFFHNDGPPADDDIEYTYTNGSKPPKNSHNIENATSHQNDGMLRPDVTCNQPFSAAQNCNTTKQHFEFPSSNILATQCGSNFNNGNLDNSFNRSTFYDALPPNVSRHFNEHSGGRRTPQLSPRSSDFQTYLQLNDKMNGLAERGDEHYLIPHSNNPNKVPLSNRIDTFLKNNMRFNLTNDVSKLNGVSNGLAVAVEINEESNQNCNNSDKPSTSGLVI